MIGILSYKTWLIEQMYASRMAPIIMRSIEHGTLEKFYEQNRQSNEKIISGFYAGIDADVVYDYEDGLPPYRVAKAKNGKKVAIITMLGAITKNGDMCSYGMRAHQSTMAKILKDTTIAGVVFHFNNAPGGSHDGTPEISHNIRNYKLNTVGFVDGMAASAHYYMASQTKHIMMNSLTDSEVGSIGSLIVSENIQNLIDAGNFPSIEIIRAPQSVNKALFNYIEPLSKELRAELNEDLRTTVDGFIAAVKSGRGNRLQDDKEMFTGKMYSADIAIEKGLADSKGTLQDAINMAAIPVSVKPASTSSNNKSKEDSSMKINFKKASSFFKKKESKAAAEEPAAAEPTTPRWTADMVFNTDGSGDGAFCIQADADGNDREFETKTDENKGNEPPTDPAVTEDDNWSQVNAAAAPAESEAKPEANATVSKLNVALKTSTDQVKKLSGDIAALNTQISTLQADNKKLSDEKAELQKKLDADPAGNPTNVISKESEKEDAEKSEETLEAERYVKALNNNFL
jgi:protease IV